MKKQTLKVAGMHCPSCEMLIKESLEDKGVKVIEISHKKGIVSVEYDEKKVKDSEIKTTIEHEGYKVQ